MPNINIFDEEVGLLKSGTIVGYDSIKQKIKVKLNNASSVKGNRGTLVDIPAPHSLFYNNGLFIGTKPNIGTPVVVGQGSGNQYYFVSFLAENLPVVPTLNDNELLLRSKDTNKITLNTDDILIGSPNNRIHMDTNRNFVSTNFYNENHFTLASRNINGVIKRDLRPNINFDQNSKVENDNYDSKLFTIGLDPTFTANSVSSSSSKNPAFSESRELIYEFQPISNVNNDILESQLYNNTKLPQTNYTFPNRRTSRSDTLSLSLVYPNHLMETTKGTVVDIFGNILDINRIPLPIGKNQNTLTSTSTDKLASFQLIKELERKSIAYHFEINAKKDLIKNGTEVLPDITSNADYARNRSRFFFDVDKEGQFKLNVPASSSVGNISLLTRYENYSTFGPDDNGNPNKLVFRDDNLDIFQDSFACSPFNIMTGVTDTSTKGSIRLLDENGAETTPLDRITGKPLRHGTPYHDILATCYASQRLDFLPVSYDQTNLAFNKAAVAKIPLLTNVVSSSIITAGPNANAGGRSASIAMDGSMELSIGANDIDRNSLWLDTAGSIIGNIGRDNNSNSAVIGMDGNLFIQVGGIGVSSDSRFAQKANGQIGGIVNLTVFTNGLKVTLIRIDDNGVTISSPGNISINSNQNIKIAADANIDISAENLTIQGRLVAKNFYGSI